MTGNFEGAASTTGQSITTYGTLLARESMVTAGIVRVNQLDMKNVKLNNETNKKFRNSQNIEKMQKMNHLESKWSKLNKQ